MGVYIKGITIEMLRHAPLEAVEDLLASGDMVEVQEPHGRLIDADMLTGMISKKTAEPEYQHTGEDWIIGLYLAEDLTYEVPTVLEAESEE